MLKHECTYKDFNGNEVTDVLYFHLSMPEIIEMEVEKPGGLKAIVEQMIDTKNYRDLVQLFKDLLLRSYGRKSEDGKRFIKTEEDRLNFSQSAAYNKMYLDLATDAAFGAKFITGLMPAEMSEEVNKLLTAQALGVVPNNS